MKPHVKLIGNIHGDEVVGREMLIYLIDHLCHSYYERTIPLVQDLINNVKISILPSLNPDGYELRQRENANFLDLNRNFPDLNKVIEAPIQPETEAIINWSKLNNFVLSANLHGGALVSNYPFDSTRGKSNEGFGVYSLSPDDQVFRKIALTYSLNHRKMHLSKNFFAGVTNGALWYVLNGGMQDWNYDFTNNMEITLELSDEKIPPATQLYDFWKDNNVALMEFSHLPLVCGIYGQVLDKMTQRPISAKILISGVNHPVSNDPTFGDFYRLLDSGLFKVTAMSPGYKSESQTIFVQNNSRTKVNFNLEKDVTDIK
eukprot:gene10658-13055_t